MTIKIGLICGKSDEPALLIDSKFKTSIPSKYKKTWEGLKNIVHNDIALAYTMKQRFPGYTINIIQPEEITVAKLKKNDINYSIGFDIIDIINPEFEQVPKKFAGPKGIEKLRNIYKSIDKENKLFPSYDFLDFCWSKKKYLTLLKKNNIPITETVFINRNINTKRLVQQLQKYNWKEFTIKPEGGAGSAGVSFITLKDCLKNPLIIDKYLEEKENKKFSDFLIQEKITGFKKYGEIKSYWINGKYSYAVKIIDRRKPGKGQWEYTPDQYKVSTLTDNKIRNKIIEIGTKVIQVLPKIKINGEKTLPVLLRIDFACCLNNLRKSSKADVSNYFVNEIEIDAAGYYTNGQFTDVKYPISEILSDAYIKKAEEIRKK